MPANLLNNKPKWSILDALFVIAVVFVIRLFGPLNKIVWFKKISFFLEPNNPLLGAVFFGTLLQAALILGPIYYFIKIKYKLSWSEVGLKKGEVKGWLGTGVKQGIILFVIVTVVTILISLIYPVNIEPQPIAEVLGTAGDWWGIILSFLVTSVVAPVSEEIYFRGFLYPALNKIMGRVFALLAASSFFGLLHLDIIRFIPITLGGVWLTILYEKTGSLYTPIIAHSVWNTLMTMIIVLSAKIQ